MNRKIPADLSDGEFNTILNGLEMLIQAIDERKDSIRHYTNAAMDFGLIGQSGDLYTNNLHFFEMKDRIKKLFDEEKQKVIDLRNKLYYSKI
jgi:hypothetical protein